MPQVNIREIDNTGLERVEYLNYTVLVPGPRLGIPDEDDDTKVGAVLEERIFEAGADLSNCYLINNQDDPAFILDKNNKKAIALRDEDIGFVMLRELLAQGLSVYYIPCYAVGANGEIAELDNTFNFEKFEDRGKFDLRFLTLGGLLNLKEAKERFMDLYASLLECAGNRGDAVALLDVPGKWVDDNGDESGDQPVELNTPENIDKWIKGEFEKDDSKVQKLKDICLKEIERKGVSWLPSDQPKETFGRYGALFAPEVVINLKVNGKATDVNVPASFDYLMCFAKHIKNYKSWFAMSGSIRGVAPYASIKPIVAFGDKDVDALQCRDGGEKGAQGEYPNENHIATNVICNIRPYGNIVWGNRTMHPLNRPDPADETMAIQLTASSFLNIRQLCIDIKKTLYRAARQFSFEPNTDTLWFNFKGAISPLLDEMKANQGINGYQIIRVRTNKKALLAARIRIIPIEAVEDFDLTVELTDSIEVNE